LENEKNSEKKLTAISKHKKKAAAECTQKNVQKTKGKCGSNTPWLSMTIEVTGLPYLPPSPERTQNKTELINTTTESPFHFLFVHAVGFCKEVFEDVVYELRRRGINCPVSSIDMLNHGNSTHFLPCAWPSALSDVNAVIGRVLRPRYPDKILIGAGHSMGGTVLTLVEAGKPRTFGGLVLFEPIIPKVYVAKSLGNPYTEAALRRRSTFPDEATVLASFSTKPPFNTWSHRALVAYVQHGFKNAVDGSEAVQLKTSPQEEGEFYLHMASHLGYQELPKLDIPVMVIHGLSSTTLGGKAFYQHVAKRCKQGTFVQVAGSHFFPMENPSECADAIREFLRKKFVQRKVVLDSKL